jgi:type I restriction enzyme R subunit
MNAIEHRRVFEMKNDSFAMTMREKLKNAFRYGFTGTPIDKIMLNTHRDFGPLKDGIQERYLSYYGIKRAIKDGATLEVHYIRDPVPFTVDEDSLSKGFEQLCEEMEVEDEEDKDFIQRERSKWKELACHPQRLNIVLDKIIDHFLKYPDPSGFKAQIVVVDRKACAQYKEILDAKLKEKGLPPDWSDVIISSAQNSEPMIERFEYSKNEQDDLIDYFKLTPSEWEKWNRDRFGEDKSKWKPPLKILIVCDRLLTGFDAPIEQVMYLDKPLRDHNLLQAIARTNRPLPILKKRTGIVIDYFGVFNDLERALNFDENIREESLIDWNALKATVPGEVTRCMELFKDIPITDTRECLLAALRQLRDPENAKNFEHNFRSLERLWEAIAPDPCLYPFRHQYNWLCSIYLAHRRKPIQETYGELSVKTRELIQKNTTFLRIAESIPVFKIDKDYVTRLDDFPSPSDKAAALEALLLGELSEDDPSFLYRQLGERLQRIKAKKDARDSDTIQRLQELQQIADETVKAKDEPARLNLTKSGEYGLYTVLRAYSESKDEVYIAECARKMVAHLVSNKLLTIGWSNSKGGRMRVEQSLLAESWNPPYTKLGFDPDMENPAFLAPAVEELAKSDGIP